MNVMSFNLWSDAPSNSSWVRRRDAIADVLRRHGPDFAGLQEATQTMIADLAERLDGYAWIGHGRDDGKAGGEHTPIFYRTDRWELVAGNSFWLAEDCEKAGRGWDAQCHRIVTWARLRERIAGAEVVHFNTHFDHLGRTARVQSALLLLRKIHDIARSRPVVVTGDFNSRESSTPYRLLTGMIPFSGSTVGPNVLRDTRYEPGIVPEGHRRTFRGLLGYLGFGRIDYVFVKNEIRTIRHAVLDDGAGASDHRPVLVQLELGA
jgi:endonuclease/exonuclease/phosphatase family metal-dependent hydrolase